MVARFKKYTFWWVGAILVVLVVLLFVHLVAASRVVYVNQLTMVGTSTLPQTTEQNELPRVAAEPVWPLQLDTAEYDKRLLVLANYVIPKTIVPATSTASGTSPVPPPVLPQYSSSSNVTVPGSLWPPAAVYPQGGAILPYKRILAYYGNFYSVHMGILGEYEPEEVLRRLQTTADAWNAADPTTPVQPAIEYIAMVAQADAGRDGMYRAMMPATEIEKAYSLAKTANAILILDMQIGLSTIEQELPKFKPYLERPEVHLALDPEFSMKTGDRPGTVIGTFSAADINYVITYMSEIVRDKKLPPKVLLVHRFTQNMVTGYDLITPTPEVQVVMVMDGWGSKDLKRGTYAQVIKPEPVQFAGLKIFYKNDLKSPSTGIFTPTEALQLDPKPIFIQYQ